MSTNSRLEASQFCRLFAKQDVGTRIHGTWFGELKLGETPTATAAGQADGNGIPLSASRTNAFEVNADTGSTDLSGDYYVSAIKGNLVHGTADSNSSMIGVLGMINNNTAAFGSGDKYAVRGHLDFWGSTSLTGANVNLGGVSAYVEHEGTTTVDAGNVLCGLQAYQVGATPTLGSGALNPALWIRSTAVTGKWQYGIYMQGNMVTQAVKIGSLSSTTAGSGVTVTSTYPAAVEIHADDGDAALGSPVTARALDARFMNYASVAAETWGLQGKVKLSAVARTANVAAGVVGAFESTGTCSMVTGSGNTYCAGVMGRLGGGGTFTIGSGTYACGVLAFNNTALAAAFTGTGTVGFMTTTTDTGGCKWDYGLYVEGTSAVVGALFGTTPTASAAGQVDGGGIALTGSRRNALEVNADTGSTNLSGDYYVSAIKGNVVHGTADSNSSIIGVLGMLNNNTAAFGSGDKYAVRGHLDFWGSTSLTGANVNAGGVSAYIENEATTTIDSGNVLCGVQAYQVGGVTNNGTNPALWIRSSSAAARWQYGVYMNNAAVSPWYSATTATGSTALSNCTISVTDQTTASSGYARGLYVAYTGSGAKTGTAELNPIACDMTVSANVAHAFNVSLYNAVSGSPTVDYFSGLYLYFDATGTATVNRKYGIQLEIDNTNASTESGFIYLYRHGTTNLVDSIIRLERSSGSPLGTASYLIKAPALSAEPTESGDITSGKTCIGGIRCIFGSTVGVIPLYSD